MFDGRPDAEAFPDDVKSNYYGSTTLQQVVSTIKCIEQARL